MTIGTPEFRSIIERHQRMVYSIALRIVGETGAAEEVAQDVFLELFRCADRPEGEDHLRFWLRRVAVHRSTDALRRRAVRPEANAEEWIDEAHLSPAPADGDFEIKARVEDILHSLPENLRVPIVLRYQEEMAPTEIAALLKQPVATVKSNLQRGLKLLRRKAAVTMKGYVRESA